MADNVQHTCPVCQQPASLRCAQCKAVWYCSAEHSRADWKSHKAQCRTARSAEGEDLLVKALLFPVLEDEPRLVQVKYTVDWDEDNEVDRHKLDLSQWLWPESLGVRQINSHGMLGRGEKLDRTLHMYFDDNYMSDGSPVNRCVQKLTDGKATKWGGNILVFRAREPTWKYTQYYNAKLDDVAPMIAFFKDYTEQNLHGLGL